MKCRLCKENKLSREFPFDPLTENCDHPLLHCLDCATESVRKNKKCSQCETTVTEDNEVYKEYLETLDFLFPPEEASYGPEEASYQAESAAVGFRGEIYVTTLSGDSASLSYRPLMTILDIKKEVESKLKTPPENQRLLYQNKELQTKSKDHKVLTLKDHNVPPNSTLHLIILLCAVPDNHDKVVFDFYWGLPPRRDKDYLDVSVLVYSGREYLGVVNYRNTSLLCCRGVNHSGPADMDYVKREGRQQVKVNLKSVPRHIDKLVFTLSAWASLTISEYPYYRLRFYDENFPDKQLCKDKVDHLKDHESVIMCCLSKKKGMWEAISIRKGSAGFTRNYFPLKLEIDELIRKGMLNI